MTGLSTGRVLARNTAWNLAGNAASIIVALASIPIILKYLGTDRLGVIGLVWIVEGQFGIFDLGLSHALTKLISEKLGASKEEETPPIFWCTLLIMVSFGAIGALLLYTLTPWLVYSALKVPIAIQLETITAFHLVAFSLPVVISSAALRGLLAAHQRFDLLNVTRVPISLASYLAPLLAIPYSATLQPIVLVLVASRFVAWAVHFILCLRVSPILGRHISAKGAPLRRMFNFGGWMTITNVVGPIMVNLDRMMIGALISMKAVAYYATPYEAATKLWIIPSSLTGVLFPALSAALVQHKDRAALLYERALKYIFLCMFPIALVINSVGHWGLEIWLGSGFAEHSSTVLRLLVIGVFFNSLAQLPFWQIQAAGRPDLSAKAHLIELPCYLVGFWWLTTTFGITGAGIAWVARTTTDTVIMFWLSGRLLPETKKSSRRVGAMCAIGFPFLVAGGLFTNHFAALIFAIVACITFAIVAWKALLTPDEKTIVRNPWRFLIKEKAVMLKQHIQGQSEIL